MSYIDRSGARAAASEAARRQRENELEMKAERYSQLHPDGDHPVETRPQRLLHRWLGKLRRGRTDKVAANGLPPHN